MARQAILNANASLYFNGASNIALTTLTPTINGGSCAFWIKTPGRNGSYSRLFAWRDATGAPYGGFDMQWLDTSGFVAMYLYNAVNSASSQISTRQVKPGDWSHVICQWTQSTVSFYIDNVSAGGGAISAWTAPTSTTPRIMSSSTGFSWSKGSVSNFIYADNTQWTADQRTAIYNGTAPAGASVVLPLSEGAGSIAYDTSGNANNGTITSGTWTRDTPTKTRKLVNDNLVYNGDFEIAPVVNVPQTSGGTFLDGTATGSASNNVFGWANYLYSGTRSAQFDTSVSYSGRASLKLSTLAANSGIGVGTNTSAAANARLNNIPILPNTSYTASVRVKTSLVSGSSTTGVRVFAQTFLGDMITSVTSTDLVTGLVTTQDWTQYTATFTTGATARFININCSVTGTNGAATLIMDAWFDDIQLYPTTPVTRLTATTRLIATGRSAA